MTKFSEYYFYGNSASSDFELTAQQADSKKLFLFGPLWFFYKKNYRYFLISTILIIISFIIANIINNDVFLILSIILLNFAFSKDLERIMDEYFLRKGKTLQKIIFAYSEDEAIMNYLKNK